MGPTPGHVAAASPGSPSELWLTQYARVRKAATSRCGVSFCENPSWLYPPCLRPASSPAAESTGLPHLKETPLETVLTSHFKAGALEPRDPGSSLNSVTSSYVNLDKLVNGFGPQCLDCKMGMRIPATLLEDDLR